MDFYSGALKGWKISIKTFLGILSFVCISLFFQGQAAAQAARFKTAFIRASDNKVYQIHYQRPVNIEDFLISNIDGDPVPRNIAAELYLAARFLNEPPPVFKEGELKSWVDDEYRHTAKWKNYHSVATYVGSISAGFLTGQLTSGISVTTSIAQSTAGKHAIQGLTSITTLVGEQAVLAQAYAITDVFVERTVSKRRIVDNLLSSANAGTEINIDDLKSAYNALLQSVKYGLWVGWMVEEYLTLPSRWERLWTFAKTIFPLSSLGQFFASAGQNIEDLRTLQRIFEESDRQIAAEASATVDNIFDEDTIASHVVILENDGFFQNKGPRLLAAIPHLMLEVGDPPTILDLSDYFRDPNGDTLTYEVWADDYDEIEGERNGSVIELTPIARGSTTVRIIATDPSSGLEEAEVFFVFVTDPPRREQNQKPKPVNRVPDQTVEIGESLSPLDISGYFHDPDGDTLTYTAWSIPTSIVRVEREGSEITITPLSEGSTTVTVRATDPDGLRTFQRISVTVTAPQTPQEQPPVVVPPIPPSQGFEKGDAVIVQNTAPSVLNIRGGAGLAWGKKGQVSDGATGTIIDGPVSKNGFIWWKIKWNDSNKVVWTNRPVNNEAWSIGAAIDGTEYLALRPSDPVVQSFDLAIQSITVNKTNLSPDEYFTLNITIHNKGPGRSAASDLSYYHSSVQGRMPTDRPQLQGTVSLDPIAPNKSIIKSIRLQAPSTSRTYYYGAWLIVHGGDTDINNDVATEVGVIVTDSPNQISSNSPDLVVESISANKVVLDPGEDFRLDAIVRNQGEVDASSTYLRYYRSSDSIISPNDTEVGDNRMTTPDAGQTYDKWERLRAPDTPGVYYYGACVDSVTGENNTGNNCSEAVVITVQATRLPDLIVESIWTSKVSIEPGETFTLYTRVKNQGTIKSSATRLYYYGPGGSEIGTTLTGRLFPDGVSEKSFSVTAPNSPGAYTYKACVSNVGNESNRDNNCSVTVSVAVGLGSSNTPPSAVDSIPTQALTANTAARRIDVSIYFRDTDGDRLTYTVRSDNTNVATAGASGAFLTITPVRVGSATLTVTASDGVFTATQRFSVTVRMAQVRNQAPVAVSVIPAQSMTVGAAGAIQVSGYFRDSDGDNLTYTARSDNTNVATTFVSGVFLTITPVRVGSATLTVTASDGVFTATQRFSVTVRTAPVRNQAPVAVSVIPAQSMTVGAAGAIQVSGYFRDSDSDSLTYTARSDNTNVATTSVSGVFLTITPVRVGSATVTVTASDGVFTATQRITVNVRAAQSTNQAPSAIGTISPKTLTEDGTAWRVDVSGYFHDSDDDRLTYTANSDNRNVATVRVSGSQVTITPQRAGSTMVHVTASDGALRATQSISVTVTSTPPEPDPTSFDLAIQSVTVSKNTLAPGESFTLSITIRNNGPGISGRASLSYYHSSIQGRAPTDPPQLQGEVDLNSLASGASITKVIRLNAPSTPRTYYYGAWLSANSGDTNLFNDVATEIGMTVRAVQAPDVPDLVVQSTRVSESTLAPGESFRFYATVINNGTDPARRTTLRYYRSTDSQISTADTEVDTDSIDSLNPDETDEVWDSLSVPSSPGTYYYGVCIDSVSSESNTNNNCSTAVRITVQPPGPPDLIVESVSVDKHTLKPGERFRFEATVRNQGTGESEATDLHYYLSTNSNISDTDTHERLDSVGRLDADETSEEWSTLTAPDSAGTYYFGACVDSVSDESNTNNNCSTGVRITVQTSPPDLVVESISANETTVEPGESFRLSATVRNRGTGDAPSTTLRYYRSSNSSISAADTEVDTDSVSSLDADETSDEWDNITAPSTPGTYYYGACVDSVSDESTRSNNCSTSVRITVEAPSLSVGDSVFAQNTVGGGLNGVNVRSGAGTGFDVIGGVWNNATGTITDGPRTANGYTWWKVRWSNSNKVVCDENPCEGWTVEFFNGARIIAKPGLAAPTFNAVVPTESVLLPNYPNPFNPETWIPYQLSEPADVTVSIYSVNGALVRRLELGHKAAGMYQSKSHAVYWDGRNDFGERVASGVYFYTFTAGEFTATRKMLIRK